MIRPVGQIGHPCDVNVRFQAPPAISRLRRATKASRASRTGGSSGAGPRLRGAVSRSCWRAGCGLRSVGLPPPEAAPSDRGERDPPDGPPLTRLEVRECPPAVRIDGLGLEIIASADDRAAHVAGDRGRATRPAHSRGHRTGTERPASPDTTGPISAFSIPVSSKSSRRAACFGRLTWVHASAWQVPPGIAGRVSRVADVEQQQTVLVVEQEHAGDPATNDRLQGP